jgi:hypothetical protein
MGIIAAVMEGFPIVGIEHKIYGVTDADADKAHLMGGIVCRVTGKEPRIT